jgi:hypothetical protein
MTNKATGSYGKNANRAQTERSFKRGSRGEIQGAIDSLEKRTINRTGWSPVRKSWQNHSI